MNIEQQAWEEANAAEAAAEEVAAEAAIAEPAEEPTEVETEEVAAEGAHEESQETPEEPDEAAAKDEDDFQDLLDPIPTKESLLEKYTRIPNSAKDEMVSLAENWRATDEKLKSIGGDDGIEVLKPVLNMITDGEATSENVSTAFGSIYKANPYAAVAMTVEAATYFIDGENRPPEHKAVGDAILQRVFGTTADAIRDYVRLEQAGIIDRANDLQLIDGDGVSQKLQSELERVTKELSDIKANPESLIQKEQVEASDELETALEARVREGIARFYERGRWEPESELARSVTESLLAELKRDPEFKKALKYVRSNGYSQDFVVSNTLTGLVNKAKTRAEHKVKEINGTFRNRTEASRNAQVKEKIAQTKPKSETLTSTKSIFDNSFQPTPDFEREAFEEARGAGAFI